jgi:hypothetical protein
MVVAQYTLQECIPHTWTKELLPWQMHRLNQRKSYAPKQKDAETNCRFPFPANPRDATSLTSNKMHRAAVSDPNPITKTPTMEITKTLCP